ncbi:hypothetical protein HY29_02610 [Hyphomonas beringensis]|uniref:Fe2OG dioxygenase domain-containing protein n=1 Tax=Hyphomonas beringensis TaxID=1280946 RepID=A0A062UBI4_9PROT|nr:Fe2+-dependent dioxygenase [Hyphomonas beringensis]KCZ53979.1 hypothetical protein HY29_02610 [Hyphomonas beringensis]
MLLTLSGILNASDLEDTRDLIATLGWRDGAETAGGMARAVKRNQQADLTSRTGKQLREQLKDKIERHPVLRAATQPRRFSKQMISKTENGGGYGFHVDNAFMGAGDSRIRTDMSYTLFLSEPDTYEGGELQVELAGMTQSVKLPAGDMVLYPSTSLHRVAPVTSGTRLVCIGWIESSVRDEAVREVLFDLENLRSGMAKKMDLQSPELLVLSKTISNLLRQFGQS